MVNAATDNAELTIGLEPSANAAIGVINNKLVVLDWLSRFILPSDSTGSSSACEGLRPGFESEGFVLAWVKHWEFVAHLTSEPKDSQSGQVAQEPATNFRSNTHVYLKGHCVCFSQG